MKTMLIVGVVLILNISSAFAGTSHIEGPGVIDVPNDGTTAAFEIIVDTSTLTAVDAFEYVMETDGSGLEFDYLATQIATNDLASNADHMPQYLFYGDSDGCFATQYRGGGPTTIGSSDLSASGARYNPNTRSSLGIFVLSVTDLEAAMGWHTITISNVVLLGSEEVLQMAPINVEIVPEPVTSTMLAVGALALLRRRTR